MKSVLKQSYKNFEYLIIDDGSSDDTNELKIDDPRVHSVYLPRSKNRGYPNDSEVVWCVGSVIPSNYALNLAKGKYIARLDDDDEWNVDYLEKMLKFIQLNEYEFITCQNYEQRNGIITTYEGVSINEYFKLNLKEDGLIGSHSTYFYRNYLRHMKYDIDSWKKPWNRVVDTDLGERMVRLGVKMGFLKEPLMYITPRPGEQEIGLKAVKELLYKEVRK